MKKLKDLRAIRVNSSIPGMFGVRAIMIIFWYLYTVPSYARYYKPEQLVKGEQKTHRHESIHLQQIIELGIVLFYLWYFIEWAIKLFIYGKQAYRNISFEREAYNNDLDVDYLKNRKRYNWIKLL